MNWAYVRMMYVKQFVSLSVHSFFHWSVNRFISTDATVVRIQANRIYVHHK